MKTDLSLDVKKLSRVYTYTTLQMHEALAQRAGLSGTDQKYLGFFIIHGVMAAGELAQLTGLTTGAVTGLIDRLEKKKLVARKNDKKDRRKVLIVPNIAKIKRLLGTLYHEFDCRSTKLIASFSDKDKKIIVSYFEKAIAIMSNTTAAAALAGRADGAGIIASL